MPSALLLVVLVLSPTPVEPTSASFEAAARQVLGTDAELRVEARTLPPSDSEALKDAPEANGIVELMWSQDRSSVRVHCYLRAQARWVDRRIQFSDVDSDDERGRILGLAVASMFLELPAEEPPPSKALEGTSNESGATESEPSPEPDVAPLKPAPSQSVASPSERAPAEEADAPTSSTEPDSHALGDDEFSAFTELAAVVSTGLGGTANGIGASVALGLPAWGPLWWRVSFSGRVGDVTPAQANTRMAQVGAGLGWEFLPSPRLALGLRLEALGHWLELSHISPEGGAPDRQDHWNAGLGTGVWAGVRLSPSITVYAASGFEAMAAIGDVSAEDVKVATIPRLRAVGELGFRTKF